MSDNYRLTNACLLCHDHHSLVVQKNSVQCSKDTCSFHVTFCCPICDHSLDSATFTPDENGGQFQCVSCQKQIAVKKVHYLLENGLIVDQTQRCKLCNGPTIHRPDANMGHRCYFFPRCSGQATLFGQAQQSLIFLDFETTGLEIGKDAIIEVGALKIDDEGYEHTLQTFVKPPSDIDPRISKITGITNDMVNDAQPLKGVMAQLIEFIGSGTLVAHNADFDIPWLLTSALRYSLPLKDNVVICTFKWSKKVKEPRGSLGALAKKYKIGHENAHRALADAAVTKDLYFIYEDQHPDLKRKESVEDYRQYCERIVRKYEAFVQA